MKTVLITGASRGIGLEIAKRECAAGAKVLATCRNPESKGELQALAAEHPRLVTIGRLDVESEDSVKELFAGLEARGEVVDCLYNNAGIIDWRTMMEVDASSMEKIYKVNVVGAMLVLRNSLPLLRKGRGKLVVNLSSRLGSIGTRGKSVLGGSIAYSTSKAALNMLTKQASLDLAPDGICVVSISPGWVRTDMGGPEAKYSVEESVEATLRNVAKFTLEDSGKFFGEDGELIPW